MTDTDGLDSETLAFLTKRKQEIDDEMAGNEVIARHLGVTQHHLASLPPLPIEGSDRTWSARWAIGEAYRAGRESVAARGSVRPDE
jgi:hypothetical protein